MLEGERKKEKERERERGFFYLYNGAGANPRAYQPVVCKWEPANHKK
jgi:hypothetical protein